MLPLFWVLKSLPLILITVFVISWIVKYFWDRRELYKLSWKCNGPFGLPFLGSVLSVWGDSEHIANYCKNLYNSYEEPSLIWLFSMPNYVVKNPEDVAIMLNNPNCIMKSSYFKNLKWLFGESQWTTTSVEKWKMKRRVTAPLFNNKMLENYSLVFEKRSEILVENLKKYVGKGEFDISHEYTHTALHQIIEISMGHKNVATNSEELKKKLENLRRTKTFLTKKIFEAWYQFDAIFYLTKFYREGEKVFNELRRFNMAIISQKKIERLNKREETKSIEKGTLKSKCFLDQLLDLNEGGTDHFSDRDILEEVLLFIEVASDTSAYVNCRVATMLGMHPEIQEKVYEEVMSVVGNSPIKKADVEQMPYMERFVKETMRLFSTAVVIGRHCTEDVKLTTKTIPKGTDMLLFMNEYMRDPKRWPDPLKFDPDRFLPDEVEKRHPYSYIPFSGGPRICIGYKYAFLSVLLITANVVRAFKFKTKYKKVEDCKIGMGISVVSPNGHFVEVELRKQKD